MFSRLGASVGGRRVAVSRTKAEEKEDDEYDEEDAGVKPAVQSSVVSTAKKITKDDLINAQNVGEKGKARNRRMFGMLLGTLARFNADGQGRQSKQTLKQKEVETRLEEETEHERKKLASERKTLFNERRQQQRRINLMEEKIALADELIEWEKEWEKKSHFIMTKATPSIFFLPNEFTPRTQRALQDSKDRIKGLVEKRRTSVAETMSAYDDEIKILENKQDNDNGKGVKNGEGMHANRGFKKGGKIENEPEEEMDLDSMEHHVDIKVDVEEAEQSPGQTGVERDEAMQSQPAAESQDAETEEPAQQSVPEEASSDANGVCSGSLVDSPVHEKSDKSDGCDEQNTDDPSSDVVRVTQSTKCEVQESSATEVATADEVMKSDSHKDDGESKEIEQPERGGHSSAGSSTSSDSDDKESDSDVKTDAIKVKNPSPIKNSGVAPPSDPGDESKVTGQQEQVAETEKALLSDDATRKEVTKNADAGVPSRDSKSSNSRRRRISSSSSDSTSSSSSSSDTALRKTRSRRRSSDDHSRRRYSRDNSRSKRYHRDRSRSRDRNSRRDRRRR